MQYQFVILHEYGIRKIWDLYSHNTVIYGVERPTCKSCMELDT